MKRFLLAISFLTILNSSLGADLAFRVAGSYKSEKIVTDVAVAGSRAYVGTSHGLEILNISNPGALSLVSKFNAEPLGSLAVSGDRLYVAASGGTTSIRILSIANPDDPQPLSRIENVIGQLIAVGNRLYVGASDGLKIYNVSDPANPALLGEFRTNTVYSLALAGFTAFLTVNDVGLVAVDVSAPEAPKLVSTLTGGGWPGIVGAHGHFLYRYQSPVGGLTILDGANPAALNKIGVFNEYQFHARDFATNASSIFALTDSCVLALQPGVATADAQQNGWCGGEELKGIAVDGDRVFVASLNGVTELSTIPANPQRAGKLPGAQGSLYLGANETFTATSIATKLEIFDTTDLAAPRMAGSYTHALGVGQPQFFRDGEGGHYLAFLEFGLSNRALILDIRDPASPQPVSTMAGGRSTVALHINNQYAFLASRDAGVQIYPVTFATHPTYLASWNPPAPGGASSLAGGRPHLFVGVGARGVQSLNVDNPFNIRELSALTNIVVTTLTHSGNLLAASSVKGNIDLIDVSDPTNMVHLATITNQTGVAQTAILGNHLYAASGDGGVEVYDISNPRSPRHAGSNGSFQANGIIAAQNKLLVAAGGQGTIILDAIATSATGGLLIREVTSTHAALRVQASIGARIEIDRTFDFQTWQSVTNLTATAPEQDITEEIPFTDPPQRFYRLTIQP
jgi:hypothetical protein